MDVLHFILYGYNMSFFIAIEMVILLILSLFVGVECLDNVKRCILNFSRKLYSFEYSSVRLLRPRFKTF